MTNTMTLNLIDSMLLASKYGYTSRGAVVSTRARVRAAALILANRIGQAVEIRACKRHGGHIVEVVEPSGV